MRVSAFFFFFFYFFFFKQKTAYEIVSRDWSSDVCSSDLIVLKIIDMMIDLLHFSGQFNSNTMPTCVLDVLVFGEIAHYS